MAVTRLFGASIKRREDPRLITGHGAYTDDVKLPGMTYMAILRSPYGHARIRSINVDPARQMPGVVAVYHRSRSAGQAESHSLRLAHPRLRPENAPVPRIGYGYRTLYGRRRGGGRGDQPLHCP